MFPENNIESVVTNVRFFFFFFFFSSFFFICRAPTAAAPSLSVPGASGESRPAAATSVTDKEMPEER